MKGYVAPAPDDHVTEALTATRALLRTGVGAVQRMSRRRLRLAGPAVGGALTEGFYGFHATGVSTAGIVASGRELLSSLEPEMRARTLSDVPCEAWPRWSRASAHHRTGLAVPDIGPAARRSALELIDTAMSPAVLGETSEIDRLYRLATWSLDDTGLDYGRVMVVGAPSPSSPWGWQVRGRQLTVSCFVHGDQLILIPVSARLAASHEGGLATTGTLSRLAA
ncbi:DUF3500 domain-containing protein [Phytomonospora sp. NPDC050363]|uniref:DUF3500 domain-containing protein n=1 Tax=Phytomonospora sp. NPDC050363 TaxID=3155642 RepID=UPI0033DB4C0B